MHKICFTISLFHASACFEHYVLIVRRSKLYYTASGIITPVGGGPVHRLREDSYSHKLIGFYDRDEKCLQRGTDWVFK